MIWHITKRELYDNLNSLRFAIAIVLLIGLMLANAIVHLREHPTRIQQYHDGVTKSLNQCCKFYLDTKDQYILIQLLWSLLQGLVSCQGKLSNFCLLYLCQVIRCTLEYCALIIRSDF